MQRLKMWILSIVALLAVGLSPESVFAGVSPKRGEIRVKLQAEVALKLAQMPQIQAAGVKTTGIEPLDRAASKAKTISIRPMLPPSAKYDRQRAKYGLDRWFVVSFDESMSSEEVRRIYGATAGVERSEVITPMSLREGKGGFRKISAAAAAGSSQAMPFNDPLLPRQWHYQNFGDIPYSVKGADINLFEAWKTTTGSKDVLVAVIDGGVDYTHEDLAANMYVNTAELNGRAGFDDDGNGYVDDIYGYNFCTNEGKIYPHDHGTHVAGTVAAVNNNGIGVAGVAGGNGADGSGVKILSCQVFDPRSGTADGDFAAAIVYACEKGATIAQCSWGWPSPGYYEQAVLDAIDYFTAEARSANMKGGLLFFAMGNEGETGDYYPGCYDKVVGVAAMTSELTPASYSCNGPGTDIVAPGGLLDYGEAQGVLSTLPGNSYGYNEGTSMATPHVSGTAALVLSKYGSPTFLNETLRTQILTSVNDFYGYGNNNAVLGNFGTGYLDAGKAVRMDQTGKPGSVSDFDLTAAQDYVVISWTIPASADNNINNHIVYYSKEPFTAQSDLTKVDSKIVDTKFLSSGDVCNFELTDLESMTEYYIAIQAVNRWGTASDLSPVRSIRTNAGPSMTVAETSLFMSATASQPIATASLTIGNEAEGLLKWSVAKATVSAQLQSGRPQPGTLNRSKLTVAGANASRKAVAARAEYEAGDYPQEFGYAEELWAMIGETDKSKPNSLAQWFKVDADKYPEGFNLTALWFDAPQEGIFGENPRIEIYKGNTGISQASLITEVAYNFFTYNYNIALPEQIYFAPGESFWVVAHFDPNQEGYPLPMGHSSAAAAGSNSFMSIDGGATWTQLAEALKGSSYESLASEFVWSVKARSLNPDWSTMLELDPTEGTVRQGETRTIAVKADGTKLVNGTYNFNIKLATNESDKRVVTVPTALTVEGNAPDVVVPKIVDFGSMLVGQSKTLVVEFYNKGYGSFRGSRWGADIYSDNIVTSSENFHGPYMVSGGFPARATARVELTYAPKTSGSHSGTVTFRSSDGREVKVLVQGVATEPAKLAVEPAVVDAGTIALGDEPKELSFVIRNEGKYPLEYVFPKFSDETVEGAAKLHKFGYTVASTLAGYNAFEYQPMPELVGATDITSKFSDAVYVSPAISLGFEFPYYGVSYDKVYITSYGGVMFAMNEANFFDPLTPDSYGVAGTGLISAYGRKLQTGPDSKIEYALKDGKFVVNFKNVLAVVYDQEYTPISFHIVLAPNGDIEMFYDDYDPMTVFQSGSNLFCGINDPAVADVLTLTSADMADYWGMDEPTADNSRFRSFGTGTAVRFEAPQTNFVRTLSPAHGIVTPGESVTVSATVSVDDVMNAGATFNNLAIVTNDPAPVVSSVRFEAFVDPAGKDAKLYVGDTEVSFGKVFRTSVVNIPVTVKNSGRNVMTLVSASFAGGRMTVADNNGKTVNPGSSLDLIVTVPTETEGDISDVLNIKTDAGEASVTVSGTVIGTPVAELSFDSVEETVESGAQLSRTLVISNTGNETMTYAVAPDAMVKMTVPEKADTKVSYVYTAAVDNQTSFDWVDIETNGLGTQNAFRYYNGHDYVAVELPFEFPFYGRKYSRMYIYNTGFISFTERHDDKIWPEPPGEFPTGSIFTNIIAPYWGLHSMNTTKTAGTYHYVTADRAVVSFMEYGNSMNYGVCFQVILEKDGSFRFQYKAYDDNSVIMSPFGLAGICDEDGAESIKLADRYIAFGNAVQFTPVRANTLEPGAKDNIGLDFDTDRMAGTYESSINITTNVPSRETIAIPVVLNITGQADVVIPESVKVEHVLGYMSTDYSDPVVQMGAMYHAPFKVENRGTAKFTIVGVSCGGPTIYDEWMDMEIPVFNLMGNLPEVDMWTGEPTGNYMWQMVDPNFFQPVEVGRTPIEFTVPMLQCDFWMTPGVYDIPVTVYYMTDAEGDIKEATVNVQFTVTPAPSMTFDRYEMYVKADTDDYKTVETLTIGNEGEYKLTYSLRLDPTGVGEEVSEEGGGGIAPMLAPKAKIRQQADADQCNMSLSEAVFGKKIKAAANSVNPYDLPSDFSYNRALYYDAMPGNTTAYNYGAGNAFDVFKESVYFKAPKDGINISHIYLPVFAQAQSDVDIRIDIVAGSEPDGSDILGSASVNITDQTSETQGKFYVVALDKPVFMNPDEEFCVVVTYPEGLSNPAYLCVKEEPVTAGRYMGWTQQAGWYDVAELLEPQAGSLGYMLTCLETVPGEPWIQLVGDNAGGEIEVGATAEIKLQVNAAAARMEKGNKAVLVIRSNDPNMPLVNYPVILDLNGKPVIEAPASTVYAREGETTTVDIMVYDPDCDGLVMKLSDASDLAHITSVEPDAMDNAVVSTADDGTVTVTGAMTAVTVRVGIAAEYGDAGKYSFTLLVSDDKAHKASAKVAYEVEHVNRAPIAAEGTEVTVDEGRISDVLEYASLFTDPDGDDMTYVFEMPANDFAEAFTTGRSVVFQGKARGSVVAKVTATDAAGLSTTADITVTVKEFSGIDDISAAGDALVRLVENPVINTLRLQSLVSDKISIDVFDAAGTLRYSTDVTVSAGQVFDVDCAVSGGVYILRVSNAQKAETHRFVKK